MESIGDILENSLSGIGLKTRLNEYRIFKAWETIVGEKIASRAQPFRLIGEKLYVHVVSSTWMQELNFLREEIKDKLNSHIHGLKIEEIAFKIAPQRTKEKKRPQRGIDEIKLGSEVEHEIREMVLGIKDMEIREIIFNVVVKDRKLKKLRKIG